LFDKLKKDSSQEVEPLKSEFQIKVHMWMPITKLFLVHPADLNLSQEDRSSLGKLHEQIYLRDQATAYPSSLHILRATDIKMVVDKVSPCLPVWDDAQKKGFKLYYNEDMPSRKMKVAIVNFPRNWSLLFNGKNLIYTPNTYDARTFWNQTVLWTLKMPSLLVMMEVKMLSTTTLYKCYVLLGSIALIILVSTSQRMLTDIRLFSAYSNFLLFNKKAVII